jgi:hypothetical protein
VAGLTKCAAARPVTADRSIKEGVSSSPIDSFTIPNPGYYSYPSNLPAGLQPSSSSSGSSAAQSPYQQAYDNLQVYDTQEMLSVSFGTPQNALTNVLSVLSQWAGYQANGYTGAPPAPLAIDTLA